MKLDEVAKRELSQRSFRHELETEMERIFKWKCRLFTGGGEHGWLLDITVPPETSKEDFEFTVKMMMKRLPPLVKKHLGSNLKISEPHHVYPQMKVFSRSNFGASKEDPRGVPPKIRVSIK